MSLIFSSKIVGIFSQSVFEIAFMHLDHLSWYLELPAVTFAQTAFYTYSKLAILLNQKPSCLYVEYSKPRVQ